MIEIIPNWHPFFVHFSIGLLSISIFFYFISAVLPVNHKLKLPWLNSANWSLWMGCLLTVFTVTAGWFAYNSVPHDTVSHAAMTLHRNWALPTALSFLLFGLWAIYLARKDKRPGVVFLMVSLLLLASLSIVGWLGAEAVYRYGLGVRSLPEVEAGSDGHAHSLRLRPVRMVMLIHMRLRPVRMAMRIHMKLRWLRTTMCSHMKFKRFRIVILIHMQSRR